MFCVEFLGLPGVGKTTLRKRLARRLQRVEKNRYLTLEEAFLRSAQLNIEKSYRIILRSLPRKFALKLSDRLISRSLMQFEAQNRFIAKHGELFENFLASHSFKNMSIDDRTILIGGFLQNGALFECINGHIPENTVVLFEEGFIQKSLMFNSHSSNKDEDESRLFSYLNHVPRPHMVIYIKADLMLCYERMKTRPKGLTNRLKSVDESGILNLLESADTHIQKVASWIKINMGVNVIEVNNNQALENVLIDLEKKIKAEFNTNINPVKNIN